MKAYTNLIFALCLSTAESCTSNQACSDSETCVDGNCKWWGCNTKADCTNRGPKDSTYICSSQSCTWAAGCTCDKKCEDDYYGKMFVGSMIAMFFAIIMIILVSLPCCCGITCGNDNSPKIISGCAIFIGSFVILIPFFSSLSSTDGVVDDVCAECQNGCTEKDKEDIKEVLTGLGVIVAYTLGCGWIACILGPVAAGMGCGILCCGCGKTNKTEVLVTPPVVGQVIGQPQVVQVNPAKQA